MSTQRDLYHRTTQIITAMTEAEVSLGDLETWYFLDLYEDEINGSLTNAFNVLRPAFEGAYTDGSQHFWQATADHARSILEEAHLVGEDRWESHYAMHYGVPLRLLSKQELSDLGQAVEFLRASVFQDGDNFMEWGEPLMDADEARGYGNGVEDFVAAQSGHLVIYVPKGMRPEIVHFYVERALPLVNFLPLAGGFEGLPFYVDEAECWGENVDTAWMVGTHSSNWHYRNEEK